MSELELALVSPALSRSQGLSLAVPGTYRVDGSCVKILKFFQRVEVSVYPLSFDFLVQGAVSMIQTSKTNSVSWGVMNVGHLLPINAAAACCCYTQFCVATPGHAFSLVLSTGTSRECCHLPAFRACRKATLG